MAVSSKPKTIAEAEAAEVIIADRLAELKARDAAERLERAELDGATLEALISKAQAAKAAVLEVETLCGDLVSEWSHAALKAQGSGRMSASLDNIVALANRSREGVARTLAAQNEGA